MVRDVFGVGVKRVFILLAATAAVLFAATSLMPGEPAAQTASTNGKIVYAGFDPETNRTHIYTMNPDGTGVTNLTGARTDINWAPRITYGDGPEWSPDGTKISASGSSLSDIGSCCSRNVYVMDADGTNVQRLTNTPSTTEGEDYEATWAPDGSWLAFTSTRSESPRDPDDPINDSDDREIYRMNADGTNEQQLTATTSRFSDEQPSVSPDGTKITFASNRHWHDFFADPDQLDIYVMDAADGGNVQRLTFDANDTSPTLNLESYSQDPAWSPDGTRIAYESTKSGNSDIWVMNANGTGESVNVSQHDAWDSDPAWSPDGTQITFTSRRDGQNDIWAVDAPPPSPTAPAAVLLPLFLGADTVWAASAPRNLTPGRGVEAHSPDWGTAPPGGGSTACTIEGDSGANTINGTPRDDVICARGGNDTVYGAGGKDVIKGGSGNDTLNGQGGGDQVIGDVGSDKLFGGNGDDTLNSRDSVSANDSLSGGAHVNGDKRVTDATEKSIVGFP
jgi:Tol biopolymer transport system component